MLLPLQVAVVDPERQQVGPHCDLVTVKGPVPVDCHHVVLDPAFVATLGAADELHGLVQLI